MEIRGSSILILVLVLLSERTVSMRYELKSGQTKCIAEEIHRNSMSVGKYFIVNPNEDQPLPSSHKIHVKVHTDSPESIGNFIHLNFDFVCGFLGYAATRYGDDSRSG